MDQLECQQAQQELPWIAGGGAAREERRRVALHLVRCAACRRELAAEMALGEALRATEAAVPRPRPEAWSRLALRRRHRLLPLLEVCGAPILAVRVLESALTLDAERSVREWLQPWVRLARAAL